ncbi:sialic acid binding Ig-like lectin 15, like [Alosa sapidissima]|uniref:sialic acid binding Ig-like lectin 15, like n=1 Tax=Alosa sapidissima TaxID=34773 RepID=UPI001C082E80|nr:sialic acid binding Ig-like lectin 15, like [Alosa sapidissima]
MILFVFLTLVFTVTGCQSVPWEMWAPPQVNGSERDRVALPCRFSHPNQDTYTGQIRVLWRKGDRYAEPFFKCTLMNSTGATGNECSGYVAAGRFSLSGDPRHRELSLLVSKLWLNDTGMYFCRVELDYNKYQSSPGTTLNVTGPARIISLSQKPVPDNSTLECVAVGNPPPEVTWFSSSNRQEQAAVKKADPQDKYTIRSSIRISTKGVYTCRAKNSLGSHMTVFPPSKGPTALTLWLSVLAGLLLLAGLVVVASLLWMKRRGASLKMDIWCFQNRERQKTSMSDPNGEQELVYVDIDHSQSSPSTRAPHRVENDIIYSDVN